MFAYSRGSKSEELVADSGIYESLSSSDSFVLVDALRYFGFSKFSKFACAQVVFKKSQVENALRNIIIGLNIYLFPELFNLRANLSKLQVKNILRNNQSLRIVSEFNLHA